MNSWHEFNFIWGFQNLWWARPTIVFWDWDWDFCIMVSKIETDTETFGISLKFWDWYLDFWQVVSKLETGLEATLVLVSVLRPKSRSSQWLKKRVISPPEWRVQYCIVTQESRQRRTQTQTVTNKTSCMARKPSLKRRPGCNSRLFGILGFGSKIYCESAVVATLETTSNIRENPNFYYV